MSQGDLHLMEAMRLPRLCRQVYAHAGLPLTPAPATRERFVLRCGAEPPGLFAELLEEAFVEDEAEVLLWPEHEAPDYGSLPPGHVAVRAGFDSPCPAAGELCRAVSPGGGRVLLFAVERRDAAGRLLGVTWAGLPEEEPPPQAPYRAAVLRVNSGPVAGGLPA